MTSQDYTYPRYAKAMHTGMAIFGVTAFLSGELAENGADSAGYYLHAYLGLSLAMFVIARVIHGIGSSGCMRFSRWSPFSPRQWKLALQDVRRLLQLEIPERGLHEGLSGLTQACGLILFAWMAMTGTGLFILSDGQHGTLFEMAEEAHEVGEALIPLYLALHVGSVLVHSFAGKPIWQRMWKFSRYNDQKPV